MKKAISVLAMAACMLLMCGCVRLNINLTVRSNGNFDVDVVVAYMDVGGSSSAGTDALQLSDEDIRELEERGFTVASYSQDGYAGVEIFGENLTSDQLGGIPGVDGMSGSGLTVRRSGLTYIIEGDLLDADTVSGLQESGSLITAYGGSVSLTVTFPSSVKESNATYASNDGKTLTWDFLKMDDPSIYVEYTVIDPAILIVAGAVLVVVVAAIVLLLRGRRKKQAANAPASTVMYCPQCGAQIDANAVFCPQCGTQLRR